MILKKIAVCLCGCSLIAAIAFAEDPKAPAPSSTQPTLRDPTEADAALGQALDEAHLPGANRGRGTGAPQIINRGMVIVAGKPAEALIEVPGGITFFVHEGSVINAGAKDENTVMRVVRLSADGIELEIASRKQRLILR
jgi:hypothetical protein